MRICLHYRLLYLLPVKSFLFVQCTIDGSCQNVVIPNLLGEYCLLLFNARLLVVLIVHTENNEANKCSYQFILHVKIYISLYQVLFY